MHKELNKDLRSNCFPAAQLPSVVARRPPITNNTKDIILIFQKLIHNTFYNWKKFTRKVEIRN